MINHKSVAAIGALNAKMKKAATEVFEEFHLNEARMILAAATEMFINDVQSHVLPGFRSNMKDMLNEENPENAEDTPPTPAAGTAQYH